MGEEEVEALMEAAENSKEPHDRFGGRSGAIVPEKPTSDDSLRGMFSDAPPQRRTDAKKHCATRARDLLGELRS